MGKQVDLVIYVNGVREVIGRASVSGNGEIVAQVNKPTRQEITQIIQSVPLEVSYSVKTTPIIEEI